LFEKRFLEERFKKADSRRQIQEGRLKKADSRRLETG